MYEITVRSKRCLSDPLPGTARIYVGRPSPLGNPFHLPKGAALAERDSVCDRYRDWLRRQYLDSNEVRHELERLMELALEAPLELVCWCAPLRCHADEIKRAITLMAENRGLL